MHIHLHQDTSSHLSFSEHLTRIFHPPPPPPLSFFTMLLLAVLVSFHGVSALPAAQNAASCSYDDLYTSLSREGSEFCSSMVKTPCEVTATPTQFTSYPSDKLSSYVSSFLHYHLYRFDKGRGETLGLMRCQV